jgi:acyl-CoA dehydrogenase
MLDRSFLHWPFFEERHRALAERLESWAAQHCAHIDHRDVDAACRELVHKLGRDGWLKHTAPGDDPSEKIDVRTLALIR